MKRFDSAALAELSRAAAQSPRLRMNLNLHAAAQDPIQRLLNAFEPNTYVRPHRHRDPDRWELFTILAGRAAVLTFDDNGRVRERADLDSAEGVRVMEIAPAAWHTIVALAPGTVLFEVKAGPYVPTPAEDFAAWAPQEGDARAITLERWFQTAVPGDTAPE